jgi:acetyltransferase-like isoleucine patch superfamily enzyme
LGNFMGVNSSLEELVRGGVLKIRPDSHIAPGSLGRTLGWYLRIGFRAGLRGAFWRLRFKAAPFPLFVGERVTLLYGRKIEVGRGFSLGANSRFNAYSVDGVHIGDRVTIREGAWIQCSSSPSNPGVALTIGHGSYIGPQVVLGVGGPLHIGDGAQFGAGCVLISENHATDADGRPSRTDVIRKGIKLGDNCWLGHRVTILDGVELGDNCIVGAGSVVTKSFPPNSTIVGSPARALGSAGADGATSHGS